MMYFAALLVFGSVVDFSTAGPQCSTQVCNYNAGCKMVPAEPCAICVCPNDDKPNVGNGCSTPKCSEGCWVNWNTLPCPSCECPPPTILNRRRRHAECSMPSCEPSCRITYPQGSCPTCDCETSNAPQIQCGQPKCDDPGCYMDFSTKPCPSCVCNKPSTVRCGPARCEEGCTLDYSTQPCPSCRCNNPASVQCGTPNCNEGCVVDYSTKPCASCKCNNASPSQGSFATASANTHRGYYAR